MVRHLLKVTDLSPEELWWVLRLTRELKATKYLGLKMPQLLKGKKVALFFEKPSTRTRVSLSVAIRELGGSPLELESAKLQVSRGEGLEDTVRVLSRYVDAIVARVYSHKSLEVMARYSKVPIVNALSDVFHPLQAISDMYTLWEIFGRLKGINLAFIGDGRSNVAHSLMLASSLLGVNFSVASPEAYGPRKEVLQEALKNAALSGANIKVFTDPLEAVKGAQVVYTDVFVSMGFDKEREERLKAFLPRYRVNKALLAETGTTTLFMHCLPAHRGEEVEAEVIDDEKISVVFDQAENRLYSAEAVLSFLMGKVG